MILWALLGAQSAFAAFGLPSFEIPSLVAYGFPERAMAQLPGSTILVKRFGEGGVLKEGEIAQIHYVIKIAGDEIALSSRYRRLPYEFEVGANSFWTSITGLMRVKEIRRVWLTEESISHLRPAPSMIHGDVFIEVELLSKRSRGTAPSSSRR